MRVLLAAVLVASVAAPAFAAGQITCNQIPAAQRFVSGLKPGPNTRAAQHYLDLARKAKTDKDCVTALGHVNYYAKRSAAADKRMEKAAHPRKSAQPTTQPKPGHSSRAPKPHPLPARVVKPAPLAAPAGPVPGRKPPLPIKCADPLHQDRPGGSDYHGPPVPGCKGIF